MHLILPSQDFASTPDLVRMFLGCCVSPVSQLRGTVLGIVSLKQVLSLGRVIRDVSLGRILLQ